MNIKKLNDAEALFLEKYPGGFAHPEMIEMAKKHKPDKMVQMAQESFAKERFKYPNEIIENMIKIVSRSSMVSLFEKPKFRDFANSLSGADRQAITTGLEKYLYHKNEAEQKTGFNMMLDVLKKGKLAKWSLISVCPFYFNPKVEVFMKPTTVKDVISCFELEGLEYKPTPSFEFYENYRTAINQMKKSVNELLSPDNAYFSGFLMMTMKSL